jgi:drug/metabolite transporter (DMT)-like permease
LQPAIHHTTSRVSEHSQGGVVKAMLQKDSALRFATRGLTCPAKARPVRTDSARLRGYLWVSLAASGWGVWPVFLAWAEHAAQRAGASVPAAFEALFPMIVIALVNAPAALRRPLPRARAPWLFVLWLGVSAAGNNISFFAAYQTTTVAIAVLTHYLAPLLVALFSPVILKEPFEPRTVFATLTSLVGLTILLEPWRSSLRPQDLLGAALGAFSAVCYASNVLTNKRLAREFAPSQTLFFHALVAIPLIALRLPPHLTLPPASSIGVLTGASVLLGAGAGTLFLSGLRHVRASHASMLTLLEPIVAVILGALVLRQRVGVFTLLGGVLVLASAAWVLLAGPRAKP